MSATGPVKVVMSRDRNQLRKEAYLLRKKFGLEKEKYFPIMEFLELVMPKIDPSFSVVPVEDSELIGRAAETIPEQHLIRVKESVYDGACLGAFWARSVMAHELGHYLCHSDGNVIYAYPALGERIPRDIDPEWQANVFAAELLAPVHLIDEENEYLVSKHFGVPKHTAKTQMVQVRKIQRRHDKRKLSTKRKTVERQLNR